MPAIDFGRFLRREAPKYGTVVLKLDVEGAELLVLQTIDWSALSVGVLLVECSAVGCVGSRDDAVAALLGPKGLARLGERAAARHRIGWRVGRTLDAVVART